jgi:hypothetical protein
MQRSWRRFLTPFAVRLTDWARRLLEVGLSGKRLVALILIAVGIPLAARVLPIPMDQWLTLASLKKVDDHPLYLMRHYGDYGSEQTLRQEASNVRGLASVPSAPGQAWACTCFATLGEGGSLRLGRNFDWYDHPALLLFTNPPEGYASVSMVDISYLGFGSDAPSWGEREPLLLAPYLPFDGMNEHGLGVGMMAVPHADSGYDPQRKTLDSLQLIRLLLDHAVDVEEALALLEGLNVDFGQGPAVHYLLVDADGQSAVAEFVSGEMRVLRNSEPWQVATNFVIAEAVPAGSNSECWRYNLAYDTLRETGGALSRDKAMGLLESVSQPSTIWSLVYGLSSGDIDVVMGRNYERVYRFRL